MEYRAKETFYNGRWFKSNTEAKVAESLDLIGVKWEYERKCFRDSRFPYGQYTPDFFLPDSDLFIEVAGRIDDRHLRKMITLASIIGGGKVLFINGVGATSVVVECNSDDSPFDLRECHIWGDQYGNAHSNLFERAGISR